MRAWLKTKKSTAYTEDIETKIVPAVLHEHN